MKVYRSLDAVPPDFGPSALTIGNFDGVHFGHRRILRRLKAIAGGHGWKASVLTFDPHPTHSTVERSLKTVELLAPRRAFFTHICHDLGHERAERMLPPNVRLAYDGLELEVA